MAEIDASADDGGDRADWLHRALYVMAEPVEALFRAKGPRLGL